MDKKRYFSAGAFAKLARTTRNTLHLYDRIGLVSPALRGENHYRYYSSSQLSVVNVVRILQALGMTLNEVNTLRDQRSPEVMDAFLSSQMPKIDKKIEEWVRARKLLLTLQKTIHSALNVDEKAVAVRPLPAEAIILGELNDYSGGRDAYSALFDFYYSMRRRYPDADLNYPVWGRFSQQQIKRGDWKFPDRYYFYNPEGYDKRPAGTYAVGYGRGSYGQNDEVYHRMLGYIQASGYEGCGDTYEEYPLNEFSISDETNYLIRAMITVRRKA